MPRRLTSKQVNFAAYVIGGFPQVDAYRMAYDTAAEPNVCAAEASRLMRHPMIASIIENGRRRTIDAIALDSGNLMRLWSQIATLDHNEIAEVHQVCCRFCYSPNDDPQETRHERAGRFKAYQVQQRIAMANAQHGVAMALPPFDELGGTGYDERKAPNPNCDQCFGRGESRTVLKDSRRMSAAARAAFQGLDYKQGVPVVKSMDRLKVTELVARGLGLLKDGTAPPGNRLPGQDARNVTPNDPIESVRTYQRFIEGSDE